MEHTDLINWLLSVISINQKSDSNGSVCLENSNPQIAPQKKMNAETFFSTTTPPSNLDQMHEDVRLFVDFNKSRSRRVVLISSGGTTVPLETQTVRFLDNFSAGTRGATSAEYFIELGYAVIFLHRQFSLEPYTRHFTHSKNCFLDLLHEDPADGRLCIIDDHAENVRSMYRKYQHANQDRLLLKVDFVTLQDYLFLLREITKSMSLLGSSALYYLAAAVSDFFIPQNKMIEHKIQSGDGALTLQLDQVPKIIKPLVDEWADRGYIVSFKLETNEELLMPKSKVALQRYGHQLVIANQLQTRKNVVYLVTNSDCEKIELSDSDKLRNVDIEFYIVKRLSELHSTWINK